MNEQIRHKARTVHKHKTEKEWYLDVYVAEGSTTKRNNPFIPLDGELIIFDPDENNPKKRFKFGDGVHNVIELPFVDYTLPISKGEESNSLQQDSNQALSPNALALGLNSIAGGYGFHIIEAVDNGDGTGTYTIGESIDVNGNVITSHTDVMLQSLDTLREKEQLTYSSALNTSNYFGGKIRFVDVATRKIAVDGYKHYPI
jgi:hypothetical protein